MRRKRTSEIGFHLTRGGIEIDRLRAPDSGGYPTMGDQLKMQAAAVPRDRRLLLHAVSGARMYGGYVGKSTRIVNLSRHRSIIDTSRRAAYTAASLTAAFAFVSPLAFQGPLPPPSGRQTGDNRTLNEIRQRESLSSIIDKKNHEGLCVCVCVYAIRNGNERSQFESIFLSHVECTE